MSKKAVIFPGQGSQIVGMGRDFASAGADVDGYFQRASDVLGFDLAKITFEGPQEDLTRSNVAQPAIFVVSAIGFDLAVKAGFQPDMAAGHSSGEWAALYAAGVVSYEGALKALEARGRLMQQACVAEKGGMIAVMGLDQPALEKLAADAGIQVANFNSPVQIILSGSAAGIARADDLAKAAGAKKVIPLPVAGAFYSRLMAPAAEAFTALLAGIEMNSPRIPVACNVTGGFHEADPASIRRRMSEQITSSVQWIRNVETLKAAGAKTYVECGPGKVLTGLVKRIDIESTLINVTDASTLEAAKAALA